MSRSEHDLGVALDGSFVETTSKSAAQALAKHYALQDVNSEYYVQTRVVEGKTIYRIRPRSGPELEQSVASTSSSNRARANTSPTNSIQAHSTDASSLSGIAPTIALQSPSPRKRGASTSAPHSRQTSSSAKADPDNERLTPPSSSPIGLVVRRSGSFPTLGVAGAGARPGGLKRSATTRAASEDQADVLGRILGWGSRGTAQLGFIPGAGSEQAKATEEDTSDLPTDLDELQGRAPDPPRPTRGLTRSSSSPFGAGVRLARSSSPMRREATDDSVPLPALLLADPPQPREMREVASSDSIRTAKAEDIRRRAPLPPRTRYEDWTAFDFFKSLDAVANLPRDSRDHHGRLPSSSSVHSSTSDLSRATAHDITVLSAPGDDPRFVIWGFKDRSGRPRPVTASSVGDERRVSASGSGSAGGERRQSLTAEADSPMTSVSGSPVTSSSSRWSLGHHRRTDSPATSVGESVGSATSAFAPGPSSSPGVGPPERVLMAATVERLIAELTSKIEVELLAGFFLTYRSFLRPLHLLQALITRFDWAMQPPSSPADDAARRIVRVRTFVVIRHWLLNHFMVDFYPDRELRSALTNWLNREGREPAIRESPKDQRLIKGLKKLVRRLKEMHVALGPIDTNEAREAMARQSRDDVPPKSPALSSDEDVDLEIGRKLGSTPSTSNSMGVGARERPRLPGFGKAVTRPTSMLPLPGSQSAVARSFTNALGTIGRFKRMLGNRANAQSASTQAHASFSPSTNADALEAVEYEQHDTGDLLWIKDGLARYLDYYNICSEPDSSELDAKEEKLESIESPSATPPVPELDAEHAERSNSEASPSIGIAQDSVNHGADTTAHLDESSYIDDGTGLGISTHATATPIHGVLLITEKAQGFSFVPPPSIPIFGPASYDAYDPSGESALYLGRPLSARLELDDVDLSDEDEDVVEVKKTLKRLPGAANLRMEAQMPRRVDYRQSTETVSSYGSPRRLSFGGRDRDTTAATWCDEEEAGGDPAVVPGLEGFLLDGLVESDEDEPGDVEAALRRLEGIVDDSREKKKAEKVERQMEKSERKKKGLPLVDQEGKDEDVSADREEEPELEAKSSRDSASLASVAEAEPLEEQADEPTSTSLEEHREAAIVARPVTSSIASPTSESSRETEPVGPPRSLGRRGGLTRKPSMSKLFAKVPRPISARPTNAVGNNGAAPPRHRSFLLHCRTEVLARQFCLIERDMLRVLGWQELVSGTWRDRSQPQLEVIDWETYLKVRRRNELAAKESGENKPASAVQAVIARFNLTANWVASEVVLTANPDERVALIAKFIRLAFKCYCQSNFQTLTQIIHGLQLHDVERLKKTWARVPLWEMRKFRGMQVFVSHLKNFKHLREVTNVLISEYGPPGQRGPLLANNPYQTKGVKAAPAPLGCIPFLGLFLRDLTVNNELPNFLDPTSTHSPAHVDNLGSLISVAELNAFDSLPPLPPSLPLRPLVNVHKFRVQARIVQEVLAFMEFAEGYPYEPDARWYLKCLKLRALPADVASELSRRLEP